MPVSEEQRRAILSSISGDLSNEQIAAQVGVSPGTVAAVKANLSMGRYGPKSDAEDEVADRLEDALGAAFGLERDMQLELRRNIQELEPGLVIIDGDRVRSVASGRIDITARDATGATVVIELKVGAADRDAIGQILSYMGDLIDGDARVRGILVAREFTSRALSAARSAHNIRLVRYGVRFTFDTVGGGAN